MSTGTQPPSADDKDQSTRDWLMYSIYAFLFMLAILITIFIYCKRSHERRLQHQRLMTHTHLNSSTELPHYHHQSIKQTALHANDHPGQLTRNFPRDAKLGNLLGTNNTFLNGLLYNQSTIDNQSQWISTVDRGSESEDNKSLYTVEFFRRDEILSRFFIHDTLVHTRKLVQGAYGEVWLGYCFSQNVAIKRILTPDIYTNLGQRQDKMQENLKLFVAEIKLMSRLNHPRVVRFIGCHWTNSEDLCSVTEFMPNGDLKFFLNVMKDYHSANSPVSDDGSRSKTDIDAVNEKNKLRLKQLIQRDSFNWPQLQTQLGIDILEGLHYLHSQCQPQIIHRDLKSRNILLDEKFRAKLTDFGVSREASLSDSTMTGGIGTILWTAPEILSSEKIYNEKVDIYSFGVILSELDTFELPFYELYKENPNITPVRIHHMVVTEKARPGHSKNCPLFLAEMMERCMSSDPNLRPTALELLEIFCGVQLKMRMAKKQLSR